MKYDGWCILMSALGLFLVVIFSFLSMGYELFLIIFIFQFLMLVLMFIYHKFVEGKNEH